MLFLGSRAGASHASSPSHSPPVNLPEMTNGRGGFGLAPGEGAEQGPRSPSGEPFQSGAGGVQCWGVLEPLLSCLGVTECVSPTKTVPNRGELQTRVRLAARRAGCCSPGTVIQHPRDGGVSVWLGFLLCISSMAVAAGHRTSWPVQQRSGAGHAVSCKQQQQQLIEAF